MVLASLIAVGVLLSGCAASTPPQGRTLTHTPPATLSADDVGAWLDGMLPSMLEREGVTGAAVAVMGNHSMMAERGYGLAHAEDEEGAARRVEADSTLFRIGSISKLFTATVVMQLVERGELDLDAPVQDELDFTLPTKFDQPITMRHLLTHTAGFEDSLAGLITAPRGNPVSLREAVSADPPEQIFPPGSTPAYSNYSNGLAAYVAERVTGTPFEDLVRERVFGPAGMETATSQQPLSSESRAKMSSGYRFTGSEEVPFEVVSPAPAGAISATATDMGKFMMAQLGSTSTPLLEPETLDLMHSPGLGSDDLGNLASGPRMTLGFFEDDRNGHRILSHAGDLTAFHAQLELYPDDGAGIFISLNSTGVRADSTTHIRDALTTAFADRYFPDDQPGPVPTETAVEHATAITGTYQLSRRGETTFIRAFFIISSIQVSSDDQGRITVSAITDAAGHLIPFIETEPWVWTEVGGQRVIAVDQDDGTVTAIGFDPAFTLQPMPIERALMPAVAGSSAALLLAFLILQPVTALIRRGRKTPVDTPRVRLRLGWLMWISTLSLAFSVIPWSMVANALLTDDAAPSDVVIRTGQALLGIAGLGTLPAVWHLVLVLRYPHTRWRQISAAAIMVIAFTGLVITLIVGGLLQPSITY